MNTTKFKTRIAFAIVLSAVVASFTACDSVNSLLGQKKKEDNGMLLAALTLGAAPAPGPSGVTPIATADFATLRASTTCKNCHDGQDPKATGKLDFRVVGNVAAFAGAGNCSTGNYQASPLFTTLRPPSGIMYGQDSGASNAGAPYIAGWIQAGCL